MTKSYGQTSMSPIAFACQPQMSSHCAQTVDADGAGYQRPSWMLSAKTDQSKTGKGKKRPISGNSAKPNKQMNHSARLPITKGYPDKHLPYRPLNPGGDSALRFFSTSTKVSHLQQSNLLDSTCSSIHSSSSSTSAHSHNPDNNLLILATCAVELDQLEKNRRPPTATASMN